MNRVAGDPARIVGRKESDHGANIFGPRQTLERLNVQRVFLARLCLCEVRHLGIDHVRSYSVDPNSARAQGGGKVFHKRVDRSLRRRTSRQRANHRVCRERGDEHNAAAIAQDGKRLLD